MTHEPFAALFPHTTMNDDTKNACPTYGMQDPFRALFPKDGLYDKAGIIQILQVQLLHPEAKLPTRGSEHAGGLDLYAASVVRYGVGMFEYDTGVAVAIPEGYAGLVLPRSSITGLALRMANSVGLIDSDYRGSIRFRFDRISPLDSGPDYKVGDRIGQLVIVPVPRFEPVQVDRLPETTRGTGGYGSTGLK